jgi:hypothetical protein
MQSPSVGPDDRRMATDDRETELTLRINLDVDPITGSLSSAHGASRRFSGWIGLAASLEAIRAEARGQRHERLTTPDPSDATQMQRH